MKVAAEGRTAERSQVTVEIVAHAPTEFFHCLHCELIWHARFGWQIHAEQRASSLPEDLADEYAKIGGWIMEMQGRYGDRVRFRLIDVLSLEGFFKSVIHRLGRFPAYIVDGQPTGRSIESVEGELDRRLALARSTAEMEGPDV